MIELFDLLETQKTNPIKIKGENLSYWRSDTPTALIEYLSNHIDDYNVEVFNVETGVVFEERYIKSFDIEIYTDEKTYNKILKLFSNAIGRYNKDGIDISFYKYRPELEE